MCKRASLLQHVAPEAFYVARFVARAQNSWMLVLVQLCVQVHVPMAQHRNVADKLVRYFAAFGAQLLRVVVFRAAQEIGKATDDHLERVPAARCCLQLPRVSCVLFRWIFTGARDCSCAFNGRCSIAQVRHQQPHDCTRRSRTRKVTAHPSDHAHLRVLSMACASGALERQQSTRLGVEFFCGHSKLGILHDVA